jgi:transglutaminase-like putative cysteine protease
MPASEGELQDWRELPRNYNPRTLQFAAELRNRLGDASGGEDDARLVSAVIDHFRRGGYQYSLAPPRLGRHSVDDFLFDTREGYCEHYSSAFVVLMRALDIPARVVTGYQGGNSIRSQFHSAAIGCPCMGRGLASRARLGPGRSDRGGCAAAHRSRRG